MICRTVQDMRDSAGYVGQFMICRTVQDTRDSAGYAGQFVIYRIEQDMLDSAGMQDSAKQNSTSLYCTEKRIHSKTTIRFYGRLQKDFASFDDWY